MDETHLSVTHESGNVARIYRSDGTLHQNNKDYSGYKAVFGDPRLGDPRCAYLTDRYLQIGDWRFGKMDELHLSVTHKSGKTAVIYRDDGSAFNGPRTDYNAWILEEGEAIMGSNIGCPT